MQNHAIKTTELVGQMVLGAKHTQTFLSGTLKKKKRQGPNTVVA